MQNLPRWQFDDSYVDFDNEKFKLSLEKLKSIVNEIAAAKNLNLCELIALYEGGFDIASSLLSFCRCKSSDNTLDERALIFEAEISANLSKLSQIKEMIFKKMDALSKDDEIWQKDEVKRWEFFYKEYKNSWINQLPSSEKSLYEKLSSSNFVPLYGLFRHLNNFLLIKTSDKSGATNSYNLSKCVGILKGSSDEVLRKNIFDELKKHYEKFAPLYTDLLNLLHAFRLNQFQSAGVDLYRASFEQNRVSQMAVNAMFEALKERLDGIRECVRLRAKYFGSNKMRACDLLAPSPFSAKSSIPYDEAIRLICDALGEVGKEIPQFIHTMLEKRWIEADVRENKAGGAFYIRFNEFKQPRIFSSYLGTFAHFIQQAHELGHAWHYWIMRDMPTLQTEFPMSLAESASTFNEAVLRNYLLKNSKDSALKFDILWQELKAAANFMLHISVRYDFEISFIEARKNGIVTSQQIGEMLKIAWEKWYGDCTSDYESFLPYFKLHFYKTDQYIYNYPYTIGYLISQFLIAKFRQNSSGFIDIYKAFLRDCGSNSVDFVIEKHFKKDIKQKEFWLECIDNALQYADEFKRLNLSDLNLVKKA